MRNKELFERLQRGGSWGRDRHARRYFFFGFCFRTYVLSPSGGLACFDPEDAIRLVEALCPRDPEEAALKAVFEEYVPCMKSGRVTPLAKYNNTGGTSLEDLLTGNSTVQASTFDSCEDYLNQLSSDQQLKVVVTNKEVAQGLARYLQEGLMELARAGAHLWVEPTLDKRLELSFLKGDWYVHDHNVVTVELSGRTRIDVVEPPAGLEVHLLPGLYDGAPVGGAKMGSWTLDVKVSTAEHLLWTSPSVNIMTWKRGGGVDSAKMDKARDDVRGLIKKLGDSEDQDGFCAALERLERSLRERLAVPPLPDVPSIADTGDPRSLPHGAQDGATRDEDAAASAARNRMEGMAQLIQGNWTRRRDKAEVEVKNTRREHSGGFFLDVTFNNQAQLGIEITQTCVRLDLTSLHLGVWTLVQEESSQKELKWVSDLQQPVMWDRAKVQKQLVKRKASKAKPITPAVPRTKDPECCSVCEQEVSNGDDMGIGCDEEAPDQGRACKAPSKGGWFHRHCLVKTFLETGRGSLPCPMEEAGAAKWYCMWCRERPALPERPQCPLWGESRRGEEWRAALQSSGSWTATALLAQQLAARLAELRLQEERQRYKEIASWNLRDRMWQECLRRDELRKVREEKNRQAAAQIEAARLRAPSPPAQAERPPPATPRA
eukprot:CAMPEP_0204370864 /NCGR_PEP_ID=MMETSP0469-20131031/46062_1 /ASSEMBLY_ACC=CAM_ASM_000384 /TAXON_ID=2969 /ORGANISM="Oxyrrhis marina" /LENGTH=659 /DNA_ID=CAMNT_0051360861 /DNA_START=18 /DNA_END=1993 /DNA_ORIENTATION=-